LIALARTRRMQRALAHANLHRYAPMPTLRMSLGYMTMTACIADEASARGHEMSVLGVSHREGVAYVVEELGPDWSDPADAGEQEAEAPIVYRLWLRGPRRGHLVPLRAWYEDDDRPAVIRARIAALAPTLEPAIPTTREAWMLSTRVIQRRALRVTAPCADVEATPPSRCGRSRPARRSRACATRASRAASGSRRRPWCSSRRASPTTTTRWWRRHVGWSRRTRVTVRAYLGNLLVQTP